jgi:hypothetical protein
MSSIEHITGDSQMESERMAALLRPHLEAFRDQGRAVADAVRAMPTSVLRAHKARFNDPLDDWATQSEKIHDLVKASKLGGEHPVTIVALEARGESSVVFGKTMLRMALASIGENAYERTVGPLVRGIANFFGSSQRDT